MVNEGFRRGFGAGRAGRYSGDVLARRGVLVLIGFQLVSVLGIA